MRVESVDALEWVRSRPRQFFGRDEPGGWWIVGSDVDWLTNVPCTIAELFRRVVPAPEHGEHSMRGEVLVGAFCSDVSVVGTDGGEAAQRRAGGLPAHVSPDSEPLSRSRGSPNSVTSAKPM